MNNILQAKNLQKNYKSLSVVKDVSLEVQSGQIVGLLGPNGAGKTTAFYMIIGLVRKSGGQILFNNKDISDYPVHKRAQIGLGYLPQEASVFRKLTVADNIMAILELCPDLNSQQRHDKLEALLEEFHITHIRDSHAMKLSGGERRRVEIARALAQEPKFILLDEPFAGIDPISVVDIQHLIRHLRDRDIGILITDHNVRETLDICDNAYIMNSGKVLCVGSPEEILQNTDVKKIYLGESFSFGKNTNP
ncbi:MAG: LPS export ABC transporter ATP-binding protein [Pseudomonadota bacterium]